jgi:hypothetical protein
MIFDFVVYQSAIKINRFKIISATESRQRPVYEGVFLPERTLHRQHLILI